MTEVAQLTQPFREAEILRAVLTAKYPREALPAIAGNRNMVLADVIVRVAYPDDQAGLDAAILQGLALILNFYTRDELDHDRLVQSLASILPRQLTARADAVREIHKGTRDRLTAHVIVERYNTGKGGRVQPFFERVKPLTKAKKDANARRAAVIREWAQRNGVMEPGKTHLTRRIREAYDAAHSTTH